MIYQYHVTNNEKRYRWLTERTDVVAEIDTKALTFLTTQLDRQVALSMTCSLMNTVSLLGERKIRSIYNVASRSVVYREIAGGPVPADEEALLC